MSKEGQDVIYDMVTDRIIAQLERGTVPWHQPWRTSTPLSMATGHATYRGINPFLLNAVAMERGYQSRWWGTPKKIKALGGKIKDGEWSHGTVVIFWKRVKVSETDPQTGEKVTRTIPLLRYYREWTAEQTEGLPDRYYATDDTAPAGDIAECEAIVSGYLDREGAPRTRTEDRDRAYYHPFFDYINVPPASAYFTKEERYSTLFHEMAHSTGHKSRLNRSGVAGHNPFGSHGYAKEELVAEMTAAMLSAVTGIDVPDLNDNAAAYISHWLRSLRDDRKLVVQAAAGAQKAADYIRGITYENDD